VNGHAESGRGLAGGRLQGGLKVAGGERRRVLGAAVPADVEGLQGGQERLGLGPVAGAVGQAGQVVDLRDEPEGVVGES
jgi:hypothetical protein